jgi:co-chaperonin GroES (HSP10)
MIIYTGVPTELEQEQIQSYLAVKYGITKNSADLAGTAGQDERNYFASDGSIIWDYAANTAYHNNVAGVGRDDASELDQQQSRSINTGADVTINKGGVFGTNLSYLVWGDNNFANGTSTDAPGGYSKRLNKIWRTDITGTPGPVSFSIDLTDLGLPIGLAATDYALLIDADGTFNAGATIHTNGAALAAAQLSFTNVTFADGDYFTIAVSSSALKGPANVTNNLKLWLKANAGVAGTTPITSWTDQAGNGYTATAPGNAPDLLANQINFNPSIDFTSANTEYLRITGGIMGGSTYNDLWTYTVLQGDLAQQNTMMFEALTGGQWLTTLLPWSGQVYYDFGGGGGRINGAWGGSYGAYNMWTMGSSTSLLTPNGTRKAISRDGAVILSNNTNLNGTGNNQPFYIGGGYNTGVGTVNPFDGKMAEMIIYTGVPTELEQEQIQSYLAVKYGITKNSADVVGTGGQDERNYFASDGSIIWDYAANTTYHNRVTGIGRDDASELDQQQSLSISAGSMLTLNKAMAFGNNLSFVITGDDGGALSSTDLSRTVYKKNGPDLACRCNGNSGNNKC